MTLSNVWLVIFTKNQIGIPFQFNTFGRRNLTNILFAVLQAEDLILVDQIKTVNYKTAEIELLRSTLKPFFDYIPLIPIIAYDKQIPRTW